MENQFFTECLQKNNYKNITDKDEENILKSFTKND